MKIETNIENINGRYNVQIDVREFTGLEEELLAEFGEPIVDVGSQFTGSLTRPGDGSPTNVDFTLPVKHRRLPTDFPIKEVFDLQDDADSDVKAKVYANEIDTRLQTARLALLAKKSNFTGQTIVTIN